MSDSLRAVGTDDLLPEEIDAVSSLCEAAFREPWTDNWASVGPGTHVLLERDGGLVAHALIVDRRLYVGHEPDQALDTGYVEWVATRPDSVGQGLGTRVMTEIGRILTEAYALGALATGRNAFYERLGWETWRGPTYVRTPDGQLVRSADEDGHVMILRTPGTPPGIDIDGSVAVDWRTGDPW